MRMTLWFESLRREFGSVTGAKSRRHGSGRTRRLTTALVESLEDRCLLAAGDLDLSFGGAGKVTTAFGTSAQAKSVAIQSDGKIVVVGQGIGDFVLVRYNTDGSLDTSFDGDGKLTTDFGSPVDEARSVAVAANGKIVVAGFNGNFALARYNSDGSLDLSFDGDGKLTTDFGDSAANSVVLQADGKIVVAGYATSNNAVFALARYNTDGSLDTSLDGDGTLTTDIGASRDTGNSVAVQADGKIVVAGYADGNDVDFALARYNTDGSLDTSFDGDGKLTTDIGLALNYAQSVVVQVDGKIVVAGKTFSASGDFVLVRYNTDGSLDTSLDGDGKLTTDFDFGDGDDAAQSVVLQANGKIVVVGYSSNAFAVARYNSNGSLDNSFDGDGKLRTNFGQSPSYANSVALQPDGKIVVAGYNANGGTANFALARYISNTRPTVNSTATVSVQENTTEIQAVTVIDPDNDTSSYSLAGGADAALFAINSNNGTLSFQSLRDFENPADADQNNVYLVTVRVSDGTDAVTQDIQVRVSDVDETPTITSPYSASIAENTTTVLTVTATDPEGRVPLYGITGGADQSKFTLNFLTGALSFVSPPDFEYPADANLDNAYEVQVAVTDGTHLVTQNLTVTVTDIAIAPVNEAPVITGPPFANSSQRPVISWTAVTGATEYEIWVTKDHSPNQYHGATVTQTSYTPPVDFGIGKFNLWVRAKNSETIGPWTPKYTFVINTATVLHGITRFQPTLRPTINWDVLPGAVKYDVWINDVSRGITPHIRNTNVTGTTFTPSADLPLGIYRAWVRGIAADGTAASWSAAVEFVTMLAPTITQGQNPTFNRTPTFAWDDLPGAAKYEVFIRNLNTGATTVDERNITGLSFTPGTPLADGPYRWWAIGVSSQGVRSFWTAPMDVYIGGRTDLLSPAGSSNEATPTFAWRPVDGAVRYDLWVNQVGGPAQIIRQQNLTGTNYAPITSLPTGSYRAWIRAVSSTGEVSPWSLEVAFTITAIAPLGDSESPDGIPDGLLAVLTEELQVKNRGLNTTRSSSRIIDTEEIQPEERMPRIDGRDWASMPTCTDVRSEQFDDDLLVAAIHEFLEGTCL